MMKFLRKKLHRNKPNVEKKTVVSSREETNRKKKNQLVEESDRIQPKTFDSFCDANFIEYLTYIDAVRRLNKRKHKELTELSLPGTRTTTLHNWDDDFPVKDLQTFRMKHYFNKYKFLPNSLFWTTFDQSDPRTQRHPCKIAEAKYENIDILIQDLMERDLDIRQGINEVKMHQGLSEVILKDLLKDDMKRDETVWRQKMKKLIENERKNEEKRNSKWKVKIQK